MVMLGTDEDVMRAARRARRSRLVCRRDRRRPFPGGRRRIPSRRSAKRQPVMPRPCGRLFDALASRHWSKFGHGIDHRLQRQRRAARVVRRDRPTSRQSACRAGREDWFVVEGALALHLVHVLAGRWRGRHHRRPARRRCDARAGPRKPARQRGRPLPPHDSLGPSVPRCVHARGAHERRPDPASTISGPGDRPLVTAVVANADIQRTRAQWVGAVRWLIWAAVAVAALLCTAAALDWRALTIATRSRQNRGNAGALAGSGPRGPSRGTSRNLDIRAGLHRGDLCLVQRAASALLALRLPADRTLARGLGAGRVAVDSRAPGAGAPAADPSMSPWRWIAFLVGTTLAGMAFAAVLWAYGWLLRDTVASSTADLLHFSLAPLGAPRLALQLGLVVAHAGRRRRGRGTLPRQHQPLAPAPPLARSCRSPSAGGPFRRWSLALSATQPSGAPVPVAALALAVSIALGAPVLWPRYRNGTQAFRLVAVGADAHPAGSRLLSHRLRAGLAGEVEPHRDALRATGHQPAWHRVRAPRAEPARHRRRPGLVRSRGGAAGQR